ncbi:MAG: ferredoxin [Desulfatibacillaceae bacterium]
MKRPVVDQQECVDCGSCTELCPDIFVRNDDMEVVQAVEMDEYPEDCVDEAIATCPVECISWEED